MPVIRIATLSVCLLVATSCSLPPHETAWQDAQKQNTEAAFLAFQKQFPGNRRATVSDKLAAFEYERVKERNTAVAYRAFAKKHRKSRLATSAIQRATSIERAERQKRADAAWRRIESSKNPADFRRFINTFPRTTQVAAAREGWDAALWTQAKEKNSVAAICDYLAAVKSHRLPGDFRDAAKKALPTAAVKDSALSTDSTKRMLDAVATLLDPIPVNAVYVTFAVPTKPLKRGQALGMQGTSSPDGISRSSMRFLNTEIRRMAKANNDGSETVIVQVSPLKRAVVHRVEGKLKGTQMMGVQKFSNKSRLVLELGKALDEKHPTIGFTKVTLKGAGGDSFYYYDGKWYSETP